MECHAFVSNNRGAFLRSTTSHRMAPPTRHHDEWELPDDVPNDRSSPFSEARTSSEELSETRRLRLQKEASVKSKFVTGDDLIRLRQHALSLRDELKQARKLGATLRVRELERSILKVQQVDAEFVYAVSLERMHAAEADGRSEDAAKIRDQAMEARSALAQYNLDGLWVGK